MPGLIHQKVDEKSRRPHEQTNDNQPRENRNTQLLILWKLNCGAESCNFPKMIFLLLMVMWHIRMVSISYVLHNIKPKTETHKLLSKKSWYHPMIWWYWWCWWWWWWWWWGWWWYSGAEAGGCPENEPPGGPQDVCHAPLPWSPSFDKLSGYDVDGHLGDYKGDEDDDAIFCFLISKLGCEVKSRAIKELQLVSRALQLALHQIVTASLFCIRLLVLPCSVSDCQYFLVLY